jgi:hypothetical protein
MEISKIAIVGCHESGYKAPFVNKDIQIWTMNFGIEKYDNIDILFDLHNWIGAAYIASYYEKVKTINIPVVKLIHDPNIKNEILLDETEIFKIMKFKPCTTISYIIAYAIMQGIKEIDFYGITSDFYEIRPQQGFAFARSIGVAESMGIVCNLKNIYLGDDVSSKREIHWFGIYRNNNLLME